SQFNLSAQLKSQAATKAPDWFFIDIQPNQIQEFLNRAKRAGGAQTLIKKTPMIRGRVTEIGGIASADIDPP